MEKTKTYEKSQQNTVPAGRGNEQQGQAGSAQTEVQHNATSYAEERELRHMSLAEEWKNRKRSNTLQLTEKGANVPPTKAAQNFSRADAYSTIASLVGGLDKTRGDNGEYMLFAQPMITHKQVRPVELAQALQRGQDAEQRETRDTRSVADFYLHGNKYLPTGKGDHLSSCTEGRADSAAPCHLPYALKKTTEQAKPTVALQLERNLPVAHDWGQNTFTRRGAEVGLKRGAAWGAAAAAAGVYAASGTPVTSDSTGAPEVTSEKRARGDSGKYDALEAPARAGRSTTATPVVGTYARAAAQAAVGNSGAEYAAAPSADSYSEGGDAGGTLTPTAAKLWNEALPTSTAGRERVRKKFKSSFFNLSAFFLTDAAPVAPPTAEIPGGLLQGVEFTPWDFLRLYFPSSSQIPKLYPREGQEGTNCCGGGRCCRWYRGERAENEGDRRREEQGGRVTFADLPRTKENQAAGTGSIEEEEADTASHSPSEQKANALSDEQSQAVLRLPFTEEEEAAAAANVISVADLVTLLEETLGVSVSLLTCEDAVLYDRDALSEISGNGGAEKFEDNVSESEDNLEDGRGKEAEWRGQKRLQKRTTSCERIAAAAREEGGGREKGKTEGSAGSFGSTDTVVDILKYRGISNSVARGSIDNSDKKNNSSSSSRKDVSFISLPSLFSHDVGKEQRSLAAILREVILKTAAAGAEGLHSNCQDKAGFNTSTKVHQDLEAEQRAEHRTLEAADMRREHDDGDGKPKNLEVESFVPHLTSRSTLVQDEPETPVSTRGHVNDTSTQGERIASKKQSLGGGSAVTTERKISRVDMLSNASKDKYKWVVVDIVCTDQEGTEVIVPQLKVCIRLT